MFPFLQRNTIGSVIETSRSEKQTSSGELLMLDSYAKKYENNATLYINKQNVSDKTYINLDLENNRCIVSLMYIALYLGCDVYENSEHEYTFIYDDDNYALNTLKNTMTFNNNNMNLLGDPTPIVNPHTESAKKHITPYYERTETDYLVDSNTINHFLYLMGYEILVDCDSKIVTINKMNSPSVKVVVNSTELPFDEMVRINYKEEYAEIPFFSILKECGVKVKQNEDGKYSLKKESQKFILDTKNNYLTRKNSDINLFNLAAGGKVWHYYKQTDEEYYVSTDVARILLSDIGFKIEIDYQNSIVSILDETGQSARQSGEGSVIES